jgi:hypothetical protein
MKKRLRLCLWIVLIAFLVIGGISVALVSMRDRALSRLIAPTLAELTQMASTSEIVSTEVDLAREEDPDGKHPESTSVVESAEAEHSELPASLAKSLTPEMRSSELKETRADQFLELRFTALSLQVAEAAVALFSEEHAAGMAWETASEKMRLGQWDAARRYYWQVLDSDVRPYIRDSALANLAWLEEDPEKAALLLELSCENDQGHLLASAIRLCLATGSDALADHYIARLFAKEPQWKRYHPEWARRLDPDYEPRNRR